MKEQPVRQPSPDIELEAVWRWCAFDALTVRELYNIYRARQQIFVLDQGSLYVDADAHDAQSHHLAAWSAQHELPLAYARVLAPGVKYGEPAIGRVLTLPAVRGQGWGRHLMHRALAEAAQLYGGQRIRLSAQIQLTSFYASLGFDSVGEPYLDAQIPHIEMVSRRPLQAS